MSPEQKARRIEEGRFARRNSSLEQEDNRLFGTQRIKRKEALDRASG